METGLVALILYVTAILMIEMVLYARRAARNPDRQKIRKKLKALAYGEEITETQEITRKRLFSEVPVVHKILTHTPGVLKLDQFILQANARFPLGVYLSLAAVLALAGQVGVYLVTRNYAVSVPAAVFSGAVPFLYLGVKRNKRMEKFRRQLPEALELIARALKAGHAFSSGMKLAADEFDDPLGTEFQEAIDEINFGISVPAALKNLAGRIDCPDLKFFVVSTILQRETGGNLAEIMESIASVIRERFKFQDRIRVLSAEARLSVIILTCLPFAVAAGLHFLNPRYIATLLTEPVGRLMAGVAALMMVIGVLVMKKMANIKV